MLLEGLRNSEGFISKHNIPEYPKLYRALRHKLVCKTQAEKSYKQFDEVRNVQTSIQHNFFMNTLINKESHIFSGSKDSAVYLHLKHKGHTFGKNIVHILDIEDRPHKCVDPPQQWFQGSGDKYWTQEILTSVFCYPWID